MGQRHVILSSLLLLLLGFFSSQGLLTGQVVREIDSSFDVTQNGVVDTDDLLEVIQLASYELYQERADFNHDTVVDQTDVDLLAAVLS